MILHSLMRFLFLSVVVLVLRNTFLWGEVSSVSESSSSTFNSSVLPTTLSDQKETSLFYQGFVIDKTQINTVDLSKVEEVIKKQINLILDLNLPPALLAFFKTVPICLVHKSVRTFRGNYSNDKDLISLNIAPFVNGQLTEWWYDVDKNTTLLDELLHAYYHHFFEKSEPNPILTFFQNAKKKHAYYALLEKEPPISEEVFFAHTSCVYLCNYSYKREPKKREQIKTEQPDYYKYLEQLFGPTSYSVD